MASDELHDQDEIFECEICGGDIIIDPFPDEGDEVYCNDCESEYIVRATEPVLLTLVDEEEGRLDDWGDMEDMEYD